ncbi:transposase [Actinacidiphila glaucinigra]|uniref:transposase n=1 Tax=Actinacidiphila glaucinigra TaxID=235986 RepID=UPI0035D538F7
MTEPEWAVVRELLPVPGWLEGKGAAGGVLPPADGRRVRYLVAGGITWRAMPADFPSWDRVYAFWRRWRNKGMILTSSPS